MSETKKSSRKQTFIVSMKSSLPTLRHSWRCLNEHIAERNLEKIEKWFLKRPYIRSKIESIPSDVQNPICAAAEVGDEAIFDLLVAKGFSPFAEDTTCSEFDEMLGKRPLHIAAHKGHLHLLQKLLGVHEENINSFGGGNTCLQWAIVGRHLHIVKYLLANGADPNVKDQMTDDILKTVIGSPSYHYWYEECYPIGKAFNRGLVNIARVLVENGADASTVRISGNTMISNFVSDVGMRTIVQYVFEKGFNVPVRDLFEYVCYASRDKSKRLVLNVWQFLMDCNVSVGQLKDVPSTYVSPYEDNETRLGPSFLDLLSDKTGFDSKTDTLAEIIVKTTRKTLFEGADHLFERYKQTTQSKIAQVCPLTFLCCLRIRRSIVVATIDRIASLPVNAKLKALKCNSSREKGLWLFAFPDQIRC